MMNVIASHEDDQLQIADHYCQFLNDVPMPVIATARILVRQIRQGDEELNSLVAFEFKRFLKSPTLRRYFLAAAAQYKKPHEHDQEYKKATELIHLFSNEELLVFLLSIYMYKAAVKRCGDHAHFKKLSNDLQQRIHTAFYLGNYFEGLDSFTAWLALALPHFTLMALLEEKGTSVVRYLSSLKKITEQTRVSTQQEVFKFSLTDIQANMCRRLGLGAATSNLIYSAAFNQEENLKDTNSFNYQRSILETWHQELINKCDIPNMKHIGKYYPTSEQQALLKELYQDSGSAMLSWLELEEDSDYDCMSFPVYKLTC